MKGLWKPPLRQDSSCDELHEQSGTAAQVGAILKINWNAYIVCLPPAN